MLTFDPAAHAYEWNARPVPSVTQVIRSALGDPFERVAAPVLELARQRGRAVHRACELDDAGRLDESSVDPRIVEYVRAWRDFRRAFAFTIDYAERPLYSLVYDFAGTPDVVGRIDDTTVAVVERKTGLPGAAAELQTAGQAILVAKDAPQRIRRFALQMKPTGRYSLVEHKNPSDIRDFLSCLNVHRRKQRVAP